MAGFTSVQDLEILEGIEGKGCRRPLSPEKIKEETFILNQLMVAFNGESKHSCEGGGKFKD